MFKFLKRWIHRLIFGKENGVHYICQNEALPRPLEREDEERYVRLSKTGDSDAKNKLIEHNLRLVIYIAKKFENTGVDVEDLISIGSIGLIKAVNSFDEEKKIKLATYASRCIENEILMHLRRTTKLKSEVSLEEPLNVDYDGNQLLLSDILGTDGDLVSRGIENTVEKQVLFDALKKLNAREKRIMWLRFGLASTEEKTQEEKTQKEVADMLGISQSYISRLEKKIITRLKREMVKYS